MSRILGKHEGPLRPAFTEWQVEQQLKTVNADELWIVTLDLDHMGVCKTEVFVMVQATTQGEAVLAAADEALSRYGGDMPRVTTRDAWSPKVNKREFWQNSFQSRMGS